MSIRDFRRWMLLGFLVTSARGELYLITGTPTPKDSAAYSSTLLQIGLDGNVRVVSELMPKRIGTEWIGISHDFRKAVFAPKQFFVPKGPDRKVVVLDFDTATVVKRCAIPEDPAIPFLNKQWLADGPAGPSYDRHMANENITKNVVQRMTLAGAVSCAESFAIVGDTELAYVVAQGSVGVANLIPDDGLLESLDETGRIRGWIGRSAVALPYQVPTSFREGIGKADIGIAVNDSHVLGVLLYGAERDCRPLIFRKSDKTWHKLPMSCEAMSSIRGFGRFIAVLESHEKSAQQPESAGRSEWKTSERRTGPPTPEVFESAQHVFPGRIHLYDTETERMYSLTTNQADSEILLVDAGTVYYRISDKLYAAAVGPAEIGQGRLLATDDAIRDAHWAFIKH
jgi:hypothetical protein